MSPTFRSRTARYARYSRSASRWSEPRALTNSRRPSAKTAANFLEPLVSTSAGRTEFHRQARVQEGGRDPPWSYPPVGYTERHQDRSAHRHPGGEGED